MRYAKQRHGSYTCGPYAVLNAMKWLGNPTTIRRTIPKIINEMEYRRGKGIYPTSMDYYLRHKKLVDSCESQLTIETLDKWLGEGHSSIIAYRYSRIQGHYIFCPGKKDGKYIIVNPNAEETMCLWTVSKMKKKLKHTQLVPGETRKSVGWRIKNGNS